MAAETEKNYDEKFLTSPSVIYACYGNVIGIPTSIASELYDLLDYEEPTCYVKTLTGIPADVYEFELKNTALVVGDIVFGNVFATEEICEKYINQIADFKRKTDDEEELELYITLALYAFIDDCIENGITGEYACVSKSETGVA